MNADIHVGTVVYGERAKLSLGGHVNFVVEQVEDALTKLDQQLGGEVPPVYEVHVIARRALCELTESGENEDHRIDVFEPGATCRCGKITLKPAPTPDNPTRLAATLTEVV